MPKKRKGKQQRTTTRHASTGRDPRHASVSSKRYSSRSDADGGGPPKRMSRRRGY